MTRITRSVKDCPYRGIARIKSLGYNTPVTLHDLRTITPFSQLSAEEFDSLSTRGSMLSYRDGATIISEGRDESRLIFLLTGSAKVCRINERGKEVILARFSSGDYFGEISLLTGSTRTANVVATASCRTFEISPEVFQQHISRFNGLLQCMLAEIARRLHSTSERMVDSAFLEVPERLLKLLYALSEIQGSGSETRCLVRECPPHQELAAMIGASREVVTRTLKNLEQDGQITREDKTIWLLLPS